MGCMTKCKKCGGDLVLFSAVVVNIRGVEIDEDGFDITYATRMDTESEQTRCVDCGDIADLEYMEEGIEGQDRESYSNDQDRENYTLAESIRR